MARKYQIEHLFAPIIRGLERTRTGTFAGRSTIATGSLSLAISATAVESNSIITMGTFTSAASSAMGSVCVRSINPGVGFVVGFTENIAQAADVIVMWRITGI
jgi:hypothetical protein